MLLTEKLSSLKQAEKSIVRNAVFGHDPKLSLSVLRLYFPDLAADDIKTLRELLK